MLREIKVEIKVKNPDQERIQVRISGQELTSGRAIQPALKNNKKIPNLINSIKPATHTGFSPSTKKLGVNIENTLMNGSVIRQKNLII